MTCMPRNSAALPRLERERPYSGMLSKDLRFAWAPLPADGADTNSRGMNFQSGPGTV